MSTPDVISESHRIKKDLNDEIGKLGTTSLDGTPEWFTKSYFENCLKKYYKDKHLEIRNLKAFHALEKGENYGGVLWRVVADLSTMGKLKTSHFIVKVSFENDEYSRKVMEPYDIFNREMSIYENVLPKMRKLLIDIGDNDQFYADTITVDYERSALIFEDLSVRDFKMPNRIDGIDMKLVKIVLRKLAKMHATSLIVNERENGILELYDRGMFNRHTDSYKLGFFGLYEAGTEMISNWENFELYAKKLEDLKPMYMELCKRVFDPIKGHINVLAHGDLWTNNLMVKYDETTGEPVDVIIIDYQYSAWGSPAIDLFYLFNTSLKEDMHIQRQDELIQEYFGVFEETLRKLSYKEPVPSLHRFHLQLQEKEFYAFNSTFVILPIQRNEFNEDADFSTLMSDNERAKRFKRTCFKNDYCQRIIRRLLPVFERRGLLEPNQ